MNRSKLRWTTKKTGSWDRCCRTLKCWVMGQQSCKSSRKWCKTWLSWAKKVQKRMGFIASCFYISANTQDISWKFQRIVSCKVRRHWGNKSVLLKVQLSIWRILSLRNKNIFSSKLWSWIMRGWCLGRRSCRKQKTDKNSCLLRYRTWRKT